MARIKRTKNDTISIDTNLEVDFYQSDSSREPVLEWIRRLSPQNRARLGRDLRRLQAGWPVGMPLVRKLDKGLWELRSKFPDGIGRLLFTVERQRLVFLVGFMKKSRKLPISELNTAKHRRTKLRKGWKK